jgi:hypothetical protein
MPSLKTYGEFVQRDTAECEWARGVLGNSFTSLPGSSSLTAKCHPHEVAFRRHTAKCEWVPGVSLWQFKPHCKTLYARHPPDLRLSEILLNVNGPKESWATVLTLSPAIPLSGILYLLTVWLGDSKELNLFSFFSARSLTLGLSLAALCHP